jgi:hypothetical protein
MPMTRSATGPLVFFAESGPIEEEGSKISAKYAAVYDYSDQHDAANAVTA